MGNRVARQLQRNEHGRHGVGKNQHAVLCDLGVCDAFHPAQDGVDKDDAHTDKYACFERHFEEAREGHANALHLADHVGQRGGDQAQHSHTARVLGVEAVADELGHRELAVFTQVRR